MNQLIQEIYDGIIDGQAPLVSQKVQQALDSDVDPAAILNQGMIAAMAEVGKRFEEGEYFVPEMLIAARAMQAGLALLKPRLQQTDLRSSGKVVIGTVKGDLHDIGKNLVAMMLEGAGFEVQDLGVDVPPEAFVKAAQGGAQVIGMSALLTTTMNNMQATVQALQSAGLRDQVKVVIGGAPVTDEFARKVGADAYAPDASNAVRTVRQLIS